MCTGNCVSLPTSTFVGSRSADPMRAPNSPSQPNTNAFAPFVCCRTAPLYPSQSQIYFFVYLYIQHIATRHAREYMVLTDHIAGSTSTRSRLVSSRPARSTARSGTSKTPATHSTKLDEIVALAWNHHVQYALAVSSSTGYTVVRDLRARSPRSHIAVDWAR